MGRNTLKKQVQGKIGDIKSVRFIDVIGFEEVKKFVEERLVYYYKEQELNKNIGYRVPRGMILHGPPGVGKTMLMNAIMCELRDSPYIQFDYRSASSLRQVV